MTTDQAVNAVLGNIGQILVGCVSVATFIQARRNHTQTTAARVELREVAKAVDGITTARVDAETATGEANTRAAGFEGQLKGVHDEQTRTDTAGPPNGNGHDRRADP